MYSEARWSQVRQRNARMKQTTARRDGTLTTFRFVLNVDESTNWQKDKESDYTLILARGSVLARLRSHWVGSRSPPLPRPHWLGSWGLRWEGSLPQGSHCILCFLQTYNNVQSKIQVGSNNPQYSAGYHRKYTSVPFCWNSF